MTKEELQRKILAFASKCHDDAEAVAVNKVMVDVRSNLSKAISDSLASPLFSSKRPVIVVCGSAFIMADARVELGIVEPRDGDIVGATGNCDSGGSDNYSDSQVFRCECIHVRDELRLS
jgi:hypothetical protein